MGEYQVVFSRDADRDLEQIVQYIAGDNPEAAGRLGLKLIDRAFSLSDRGTALIGSTLRKRPEVRRLIEGNYLIFYRVSLKTKRVRILRIWHAAQNPERLRLNA